MLYRTATAFSFCSFMFAQEQHEKYFLLPLAGKFGNTSQKGI